MEGCHARNTREIATLLRMGQCAYGKYYILNDLCDVGLNQMLVAAGCVIPMPVILIAGLAPLWEKELCVTIFDVAANEVWCGTEDAATQLR